jgi:protein-tyrosine phosphatase
VDRDSRRVVLDGATNFRDLGGYATRDGGITRWRTVYRSDGLHELTASDLDRMGELGIRNVYDLRRDDERAVRPNRVTSIALCLMSPVEAGGVAAPDLAVLTDRRSGELFLHRLYEDMLVHSGAVIGEVFWMLSAADGLPAVFHCHAGKDRTGLIAALLLELLGVDRETVLDDYQLTETFRGAGRAASLERLVAEGMARDAAAGMIGAPRWAMAAPLARLDRDFGGVEAYLVERAGLDAVVLDRLKEQLVEQPGT